MMVGRPAGHARGKSSDSERPLGHEGVKCGPAQPTFHIQLEWVSLSFECGLVRACDLLEWAM